jgi:Protein of unknown function (DUF3631)
MENLLARLREWLKHAAQALTNAARNDPRDLPLALSPGRSKCAEPLVQIADVAGGHWPAKVRAALVAVLDLSEISPELQLLSDVRVIFRDKNNPEFLATGDLLCELRKMDSRPWSAWGPKSGRRLAGHLRPFAIIGCRLHRGSGDPFMGYLLKDLHDAWERYLPASPTRMEEQLEISSETSASQPGTTLCAIGAD